MTARAQRVNDIPAERGINITNILLAALIVLGGIFGTVTTSYIGDISTNVVLMNESISKIKVFNGAAGVQLVNIKEDINEIKTRVSSLEAKIK